MVLVDVCAETMNMDPTCIEGKITARTKGILPVHLYGHPAEMAPIVEIANRYGLFVLEDAADRRHALHLVERVLEARVVGVDRAEIGQALGAQGFEPVDDSLGGGAGVDEGHAATVR